MNYSYPSSSAIPIPTHNNLFIRSFRDAEIVVQAVRLSKLPRTTNVLKKGMGKIVRAGQVFVYELQEDNRDYWLDGRNWVKVHGTGSRNFAIFHEVTTGTSSITGSVPEGASLPVELGKVTYSTMINQKNEGREIRRRWRLVVSKFPQVCITDIR